MIGQRKVAFFRGLAAFGRLLRLLDKETIAKAKPDSQNYNSAMPLGMGRSK